MTLNLWGTHEPLDARLDSAAAGLRALDPDVVLLQEIRQDAEQENTAELLSRRMGLGHHVTYAAATTGPAGTWGPGSLAGEEGLAILTRSPALDTRVLELPEARADERRILLSALVELERLRLWVHTTHLHWRPKDEPARELQTRAIAAAVCELGEVSVIGGDFNAEPSAPSVGYLREVAGFRDLFLEHAPDSPGLTWSESNPGTAPLAWLGANRRIDFLFCWAPPGAMAPRVESARVELDRPPTSGVLASDHFAVFVELDFD